MYGLKSGPRNHEHIEQNHSFFSLLFSFFSYDEMAREKREVQWSDDKSDKKLQHDDEHLSPYSTYIRARNRKKEERFSFCVLQIESCPCPPGQAFPEKVLLLISHLPQRWELWWKQHDPGFIYWSLLSCSCISSSY